MKYDFKLDCGDKNIGIVYLPDKYDDKLSVIIYSHGWGGNRSLYQNLQLYHLLRRMTATKATRLSLKSI